MIPWMRWEVRSYSSANASSWPREQSVIRSARCAASAATTGRVAVPRGSEADPQNPVATTRRSQDRRSHDRRRRLRTCCSNTLAIAEIMVISGSPVVGLRRQDALST